MSLMNALYTGTSGLETSSLELSVVGDNISNASTIGFKEGRADFEDMLSQSLIGGNGQVGLGAETETVQKLLTQGSLTTTGNATDLAIQGNGMFVVSGSHDGIPGQYYTRDGEFTVDNSGNLVNQEGLDVQGYSADAQGNIGASLGNLAIGTATSQPAATATVTLQANLQADATVPAAWDPANPTTTSNFSTSTTIYDSLGAAHQVDVYFRKTGSGGWEWHAMTDGGGVQGGTAGTPTEIANGTMTFDTNGALSADTQTSNFNPIGATQPQALNFNFGTPTGTGGTGLDGVTQFAGTSATTFLSQDGYASGSLASVAVNSTGEVTGSFTNGQTRVLGEVAIATFPAADQMQTVGGNLYQQTPGSGDPAVGVAGTAGRGAITSGALEQSNVDMSAELVEMISAQRNFEANSKTVQTADQLLSELIQMKR